MKSTRDAGQNGTPLSLHLLFGRPVACGLALRRSDLAADLGLVSFRCCTLPRRLLLRPLPSPGVGALAVPGQLVGDPLALIRGLLALVGQPFALVCDCLALVRHSVAPVGRSLSFVQAAQDSLGTHLPLLRGRLALASNALALLRHVLAFFGDVLTLRGNQLALSDYMLALPERRPALLTASELLRLGIGRLAGLA